MKYFVTQYNIQIQHKASEQQHSIILKNTFFKFTLHPSHFKTLISTF